MDTTEALKIISQCSFKKLKDNERDGLCGTSAGASVAYPTDDTTVVIDWGAEFPGISIITVGEEETEEHMFHLDPV